METDPTAQPQVVGYIKHRSAEVVGFPLSGRSRHSLVSVLNAGEGFWKLPRAKRFSLFQAGVSLCLADFLTALVAGLTVLIGLSDAAADLKASDLILFASVPVLTVCVFHERGFYRGAAVLKLFEIRQAALAWLHAAGLLLLTGIAWSALEIWWYGQASARVTFTEPGVSWAFVFVAIGVSGFAVTRALWLMVRKHLVGRVLIHGRAIVVGTGPDAEQVISQLRDHPEAGLEVVGVLYDGPERDQASLCDVAVLGGIEDMAGVVGRNEVDTVIVALPWTAGGRIAAALTTAERLPVETRLAPDAVAQAYLRHRISSVAGQLLLDVRGPPISGAKAIVKRAEDLVLASVMLLVLAPVLLAVAVAIKLDSRGPVIFKQPRYGYNNRVFSLLKFRSMHAYAADETCQRQTSRADPRLTRVGAFLRRHSIDEVPQLINVLRGEMSIVGPRPHALSTRVESVLLADAMDSYIGRFRVKPGITGWAQVKGWRGELDTFEKLERRVECDLEYVERWSLLMDLRILWLTLRCVIRDSHAY